MLFSMVSLFVVLGAIAWWALQSFRAEYGIGETDTESETPIDAAQRAKLFIEGGLGGN